MLHGGGLHAHTFDLTGNLLRRHARCLALDLRGHGESDWVEPSSYGSDAICDDIDAVIAALKPRRRCRGWPFAGRNGRDGVGRTAPRGAEGLGRRRRGTRNGRMRESVRSVTSSPPRRASPTSRRCETYLAAAFPEQRSAR